MTQSVFIRKVVDAEELEETVRKHPGLLHLPRRRDLAGYEFQPILTEEQRRKREEHDAQMAQLFGDSEPTEQSHSLESVIAAMRERGAVRQAVFLRPATKKALREAVRTSASHVFLEETSVFANEFEGWLTDAPLRAYTVVGPEPARRRAWFAAIRWSKRKDGWVVD